MDNKNEAQTTTTTTTAPLAFAQNGEPIALPANATQWRIRRLPGRAGALVIVHGGNGLPLVVPIDASPDDFAEAVDHRPGRYRLDAVDDERRAIPNIPPAYHMVGGGQEREPAEDDDRGVERMARCMSDSLRTLTQQFGESMRVVTEQGAVMMDSAARLLSAADAADITRREIAAAPAPAVVAVQPAETAGAAGAPSAPAPTGATIAQGIVAGLIQGLGGRENLPMVFGGITLLMRGAIEAFRRPPIAPPVRPAPAPLPVPPRPRPPIPPAAAAPAAEATTSATPVSTTSPPAPAPATESHTQEAAS